MSIVSGGQEGAWQVAACKGVRSWVERMEETVMAELATLLGRRGGRKGGRGGGTVRWFANEVGFIGLEENGGREGGGDVKNEGEQGEQTYTYLISNS